MVRKPKTPKSASGDIPSKWTLWVKIPHKKICPKHIDLSCDPYEVVGFRAIDMLASKHWNEWNTDTKKVFSEILNVFNDCWGHETIEWATREMSLESLFEALSKSLEKEKNQHGGDDEFFRMKTVQKLLEEHKTCSEKVLLEVIWGW